MATTRHAVTAAPAAVVTATTDSTYDVRLVETHERVNVAAAASTPAANSKSVHRLRPGEGRRFRLAAGESVYVWGSSGAVLVDQVAG